MGDLTLTVFGDAGVVGRADILNDCFSRYGSRETVSRLVWKLDYCTEAFQLDCKKLRLGKWLRGCHETVILGTVPIAR